MRWVLVLLLGPPRAVLVLRMLAWGAMRVLLGRGRLRLQQRLPPVQLCHLAGCLPACLPSWRVLLRAQHRLPLRAPLLRVPMSPSRCLQRAEAGACVSSRPLKQWCTCAEVC